jgi:PD-(D/E)XK nuclease superfamily protein
LKLAGLPLLICYAAVCPQGDLGEVAFVHKAMSLGFTVAKPYGQLHPYDFIVEGGKNLWRVQVKACAGPMKKGCYCVSVRRRLHGALIAYTESEVDFVVIYIIPEESWYVVPVREVLGRTTLRIRGPKGRHYRDPYVYYHDAWDPLRQPDGLTFG